ncbi:MAG: ribonuclease P protein component [Clostridia bacterium]|nr:ribonuclease P protein component [Clostridia bacterium]
MKTISIVENSDFKRAYYRGKNFPSPYVVMYCRKNGQKINRLGLTTSKKIGNAVMRNRSRRVLREAFFRLEDSLHEGYDIVLVARGKTPYVKSTQVYSELYKLFEMAKMIKSPSERQES